MDKYFRCAIMPRLAVAACLLAGSAWLQASEESWTKFEAHLQACTQQHGYDRKRAGGLGSNELGPGERAWRECAYDGVRKILIPGSSVGDSYRRVIVQDKTMTDKVETGEMTRAERKTRLEQLVEQLHAAEEERAVTDMDKAHAEFMGRVDEMRRMRRLDGIMR